MPEDTVGAVLCVLCGNSRTAGRRIAGTWYFVHSTETRVRPGTSTSLLTHISPMPLRRAAVLALLAAGPLGAQTAVPMSSATSADMARALRVLRSHPVFDGHNDLPWRIREDSAHPRDVG